jgi:NTP pyrophosphatase (non-canonical NTP hydrolase)
MPKSIRRARIVLVPCQRRANSAPAENLLSRRIETRADVQHASARRQHAVTGNGRGYLLQHALIMSALLVCQRFWIWIPPPDVRRCSTGPPPLIAARRLCLSPDAGTADVTTPDAVKDRWDAIKVVERAEKGRERTSRIDGVPEGLPALLRAARISAKAAKVGFDWTSAAQVLEKIDEETAEVRDALAGGDRTHVAEEIGDLLFAVANLARKLDHDPEALLRAANRKFAARFRAMEARLAGAGTPVGSDAASLDVMEAAWQAGKTR